MSRVFRRKSIIIGMLFLALLCLCACHKAKSSRELKKYARATHGHAQKAVTVLNGLQDFLKEGSEFNTNSSFSTRSRARKIRPTCSPAREK